MPIIDPRNPAHERLQRIMANLGFKFEHVERMYARDDFTIVAVHKLVNAYEAWKPDEYMTSGGAMKAKTGKRKEQERAVLDTLCDLLADHPGQPLGAARGGVFLTVRAAIEDASEDGSSRTYKRLFLGDN